MDPERWEEIERLYSAALEHKPEERSAFLKQACGGDTALQSKVESLIACGSRIDRFIESPAMDLAAKVMANEDLSGRVFHHYRITGKIGTGGMGVVYKAEDTNLNREVAVKVLPDSFVNDPERLARFDREAKLLASLNHPNIAAIHGLERTDSGPLLVMEMVEGNTLAERIAKGRLPLEEALEICRQIAEGLEAAHDKGVIHRDLKPANVKIAAEGKVKILDFGLAKAIHAEGAAAGIVHSPTISEMATRAGVILGTAAYMSPEQAKGKPADRRTDVWAFGCILFECLTGSRPFAGETVADTIVSILTQEPAWQLIPTKAAPEIKRLVARCLRKDLNTRLQSIADARIEIVEFLSGRVETENALPPRQRLPKWSTVAIGLLILALAGTILWHIWSVGSLAIQLPQLTRLTWDTGLATDPALSPDGKLLAYSSNRDQTPGQDSNFDLWIQQIGGGEPFRLTQHPANDSQPAFSPDGTRIVFQSERDGGGIYIVSALGGATRQIARGGTNPSFSPAGDLIAYDSAVAAAAALSNSNSALFVVNSNGGTPREVKTGFSGVCCPAWTPDGRHLLFLGNQDENRPLEDSLDFWVTPLDGGPVIKTGVLERTRTAGLRGSLSVAPMALMPGAWTPRGDGLILSARSGDSTNLWQIGLDPRTYKATGEPRRMTWGTSFEWKPSAASQQRDRLRVVFASQDENTDIWTVPVSGTRRGSSPSPRRLTEEASIETDASLSKDGKKLTFVSNRTGAFQVWLKDLQTGEQNVLTASGVDKAGPLFSNDGAFLTYATAGRWEVHRLRLSDGADDVILDSGGLATFWAPGDEAVFFHDVPGRVSLLDLAARRSTLLLAKSNSRLLNAQLSPDGRWILFVEHSRLSFRSYIAPYRGPVKIDERDWIAVSVGGSRWAADGNAVYLTSNLEGFRGSIWMQRLNPVTKVPIGPPEEMYHAHGAQYSLALSDSVGGDVAFVMSERAGNLWMAEWK